MIFFHLPAQTRREGFAHGLPCCVNAISGMHDLECISQVAFFAFVRKSRGRATIEFGVGPKGRKQGLPSGRKSLC